MYLNALGGFSDLEDVGDRTADSEGVSFTLWELERVRVDAINKLGDLLSALKGGNYCAKEHAIIDKAIASDTEIAEAIRGVPTQRRERLFLAFKLAPILSSRDDALRKVLDAAETLGWYTEDELNHVSVICQCPKEELGSVEQAMGCKAYEGIKDTVEEELLESVVANANNAAEFPFCLLVEEYKKVVGVDRLGYSFDVNALDRGACPPMDRSLSNEP